MCDRPWRDSLLLDLLLVHLSPEQSQLFPEQSQFFGHFPLRVEFLLETIDLLSEIPDAVVAVQGVLGQNEAAAAVALNRSLGVEVTFLYN